jgi:hypothetical protein
MTIAEYIAELERRLPRSGRRRVLAEVGEHLRDSASGHASRGLSRIAAEAAAVEDFGPIDLVARRLAAHGALRETRLATVVALAAVGFFVFPLYVVPENTLPPAPWVEKPRDVLVLQLVTVALWIAAAGLAMAGAALAWTRWSRLAAPVLVSTSAVLTAAVLAAVVLVERWFEAAPSTPSWPLLAAPLAIGCLAACGAGSRWALRRRILLAEPVQD